jgi:hypothetical protein
MSSQLACKPERENDTMVPLLRVAILARLAKEGVGGG